MKSRITQPIAWLLAAGLFLVAGTSLAADADGDGIANDVETSIGLDPDSTEFGLLVHSTDGALGRDRPRVAMDSDGNYHLVYRTGAEGEELDSGMTDANVGYMMIGADGSVLIDETLLTTAQTQNYRSVDIAVGSDDLVYITFIWRGDNDLRFMRLDPSADDQDGSPATLVDITDVAETVIAGNFFQHAMAMDAGDNVFVWDQEDEFIKLAPTGTVDFGPLDPFPNADRNGHSSNPIAVDSDGNVHLFFQDCTTAVNDNCGVAYGMLSGADGSVLIDATPVVTVLAMPPHGVNYQIMLDSEGMVNLVWADKRGTPDETSYCDFCSSGGQTFYARLDPSLDDQDGSVADMSVIKIVDDISLGGHKYLQADMDASDEIHVFSSFRGPVTYFSLDTDGNVLTPANMFAPDAVGMNGWNKKEPMATAPDGRVFYPILDSEDGLGSLLVSTMLKAGASGGASGKVVGGRLAYFEAFDDAGLPNGARNAALPEGFEAGGNNYRLVIDNLPAGGTATVTVDTGSALDENFSVAKYDGSQWFLIGASKVSDTAFAVTLTDGGPGDADGAANGMIVDPLALGVAGAPVQTSGGGGGCVMSDGRGPLDPLFPALLLLAGLYLLRRRMAD